MSGAHAPSPDAVMLVQRFVNTLDYPAGPDQLAGPAETTRWLASEGVSAPDVSDRDVGRLVGIRETLRDMLEAHAGENVDPAVSVRLQRLLGSTPLRASFSERGATLAPSPHGVDGFLARLAAAILEATLTGTWERLKVCRNDTCRFAYYDRSKNGRRAWCTMRVCGSREKARTYRERRKVQRIDAPSGV